MWDVDSGHELRTLVGHSGCVWAVAVRGDGRVAVSASHDHTLKVWDLDCDMVLATFTSDAAAMCCAFIDNRKLIAGDALGRVHFLELENRG